MKIAVTGFRGVPASWGGVEHQCEQVYSRLAAKGHKVIIFARSSYVDKRIRFYKGMEIKNLPTINIKGLEAFLHTFLAVMYAILKYNPDIIHIYTQGPCLFSWLPRIFRPRMRVFFTCQGLDWQRKKWSRPASWCIRLGEICSVLFPHCRVVVSKELQKYYQSRYNVQTHYIPNGVQSFEKRPPNLIRNFGLSKKDYFLFVGRLVPEKRLEDIIKAFLRKLRKSKLVIVGDSASTKNYVEELKQMAEGHPSVIFTGFQYGEALEEFFSNARAFVTASELEGLPLALLEALSHGLMCIATDIAPHREVLEKVNGLLFPTGDLEAFSNWMDKVEKMPDSTLDAFSRNSVAMVAEHFSWDSVSEKLEQLYQESLLNRVQ